MLGERDELPPGSVVVDECILPSVSDMYNFRHAILGRPIADMVAGPPTLLAGGIYRFPIKGKKQRKPQQFVITSVSGPTSEEMG